MNTVTEPIAASVGYDQDFYAWLLRQAALMREARVAELDLGNLAEEMESMGKRERRSVISLTQRTIEHLLRMQLHPDAESLAHWKREVRNFRQDLARLLRDSPSLRARMDELLAEAWTDARADAAEDLASYGVRVPSEALPEACPYSPAQVLDKNWWPGG